MSGEHNAAYLSEIAPLSYQGGKSRLAKRIVDEWWPTDAPFWDLCCGCGAISIEMVNRGYPAEEIWMVDAGPWGTFWNAIGDGTFSLTTLADYVAEMPTDPRGIKGFLEELSQQPASIDTAEVFALLQAGSFGGKAIWIADDQWRNTTFRSYWEPTATSNRRSPVNPMMPMPATLLSRLQRTAEVMQGVYGQCADVLAIEGQIEPGSLVYIDPPYDGTTAYGHALDVVPVARRIASESTVFVSEGRPLSGEAVQLSTGRAKGGISGDRAVRANEEWLSRIGKEKAEVAA